MKERVLKWKQTWVFNSFNTCQKVQHSENSTLKSAWCYLFSTFTCHPWGSSKGISKICKVSRAAAWLLSLGSILGSLEELCRSQTREHWRCSAPVLLNWASASLQACLPRPRGFPHAPAHRQVPKQTFPCPRHPHTLLPRDAVLLFHLPHSTQHLLLTSSGSSHGQCWEQMSPPRISGGTCLLSLLANLLSLPAHHHQIRILFFFFNETDYSVNCSAAGISAAT